MVDPLCHQRCGRPCQRCPPIVPYEVRALDTKMVQYTKDVANEGGEAVLRGPFQLVGGAEAAKVGTMIWNPAAASAGTCLRHRRQQRLQTKKRPARGRMSH